VGVGEGRGGVKVSGASQVRWGGEVGVGKNECREGGGVGRNGWGSGG